MLEYASIAWPGLPAHLRDRLERFQRRVFKVILRLPVFEHSDHDALLLTVNQASLQSRRESLAALLAFPGSVFPTGRIFFAYTYARKARVYASPRRKATSKLAKSISVPFGAGKPLICHSERDIRERSHGFCRVASLEHACAIEAWASGNWQFQREIIFLH